MQIYLASSALKKECYDLIRTIEIAQKQSFSGVQLYLGDRFLNPHYVEAVVSFLNETNLQAIVHLQDEFKDIYIQPTQKILSHADRKLALIHYKEGMQIPSIKGVQIGLENAISGYDEYYYSLLDAIIRKKQLRFAFDIPRLFGSTPRDMNIIDQFVREKVRTLNQNDVIHLIDQYVPGVSRRMWCSLGNGLMTPYVNEIISFTGAIVLEYEKLEMALESKRLLEKRSKNHQVDGT